VDKKIISDIWAEAQKITFKDSLRIYFEPFIKIDNFFDLMIDKASKYLRR
jgi:hypothetical protein